MSKQIVPNQLKTHIIEQIIESVVEPANTAYFGFIGDHISDGVIESDVTTPTNSQRYIKVDTFRKMIMGKKITSNDMKIMVKRYNWEANTVYSMYDDEDATLFDKNFFTVVDETAYKHVYKCLYNANGNPSTAQPTFADVDVGDDYYETSDGYQWKYMYSVDSVTFNKFATQSFIPIGENANVVANSINGSINVIKVDSHGQNYNNHTSGIFTSGDLRIGGNTVQYKIPDASDQSGVAGFYSNTILYLTAGTGAGEYRRVLNSNTMPGVGVVLHISSAFSTPPNETTSFEVTPEVKIFSDDNQTVNAVARAIVNANASNSIHKVEMLEVGANYNYATANVLTGVPADADGLAVGTLVVPTPAEVRPIISPTGGHGANVAIELGGSALGIYTKFANTENDLIIAENNFSQFGLLRDPKFNNIELNCVKESNELVVGFDGSFSVGEKILQIKKIELNGEVSVTSGNNKVESSGTPHFEGLREGMDYVFLRDESIDTYNFISKVDSVVNSTVIILEDDLTWTSSNTEIYHATPIANGVINTTYNAGGIAQLYVDGVEGVIRKNHTIIGTTSYAVANVVGIDINERIGTSNAEFDFTSYNQMVKIIAASVPAFTQDEIVYQTNSISNTSATFAARVHSSNASHLFLTETEGTLNTSKTLIGESVVLGAGFTKYSGDLDPTSGEVIFLQNDVAVSRSDTTSEEILVILEF